MFIFRWQIYLLICHSIIIIAHLTNKMQCNLDHKPVYRDQSSTEVSNKRPTVLLKTSFWHLCQSDNNYQTPVRSVLGMRKEWTNQGTSVFRRSFSNVWVDWIQTCFFLVVLHWRKGSCRYWFFAFINKHTFQYADDCFITSQHALCICHLVTALFFFTVIIPIMCASKSDRYPMSTTLDWNNSSHVTVAGFNWRSVVVCRACFNVCGNIYTKDT